jgi:hypothetical protein
LWGGGKQWILPLDCKYLKWGKLNPETTDLGSLLFSTNRVTEENLKSWNIKLRFNLVAPGLNTTIIEPLDLELQPITLQETIFNAHVKVKNKWE